MPRKAAKAQSRADAETQIAARPPQKTGRPSTFNAETAQRILDRLLTGEPLSHICADPDMPKYITVWKWENDYPEFAKASALARENGTHHMAGDCVRIADDMTIDPAHKRVMVDTRMRLIGQWNRRVYGQHSQVDVTIDQSISITGALEAAKTRVIEGMIDITPPAITDQADE